MSKLSELIADHYSTGDVERMAKAIEMHLAAMRQDGDEIPEPSRLEVVEVR